MVGQRIRAVIVAGLMLAVGCKKDDAAAPSVPASGRRTYILCEGRYGTPTAALSVYLPEKDSVYSDAFGAANAPGWGDVAQSLLLTDDEIFICVNQSDKIYVADRATFVLKHTITVRKPRYIQPINDSVAMVSTLYSNTLFRLSLRSHTITDSLKIARQNPEGMVVQSELLYVCPWDDAAKHIYVVEDGRRVVDSILVGEAPHSVDVDKDGRAWVLSGNSYAGVPAKLTRVNLIARLAEATLAFPSIADPIRLTFNPTRDTLYYIGVNYGGGTENNGVFRMAITGSSLPTTPFVAGQVNQYFWALGIEPRTGIVHVGDPVGFGGRGTVSQYTPQGMLLKQFQVGVGPAQFYFE